MNNPFSDPKFCNNNTPTIPAPAVTSEVVREETLEEKRARIFALYTQNSDPEFTPKEDLSYMLPGRIRRRGNLRGR